ncbi:retropepsin-like aspartic protease [Lutimonas sp.]|uniref:retropepsin-like aspartic protease n=1 Tax=Lutimonas sp. TaxID=1872403 RepID=UPI003D9BBB5B
MQDLKEFLFQQGYVRIKLKKTITNHFEIKAKINGVKGNFILDTGASKSCVGTEDIDFFNLKSEESEHKASGAGPSEIDTLISSKNEINLGKFKLKKLSLILIDLSHINKALEKQEANPVKGIIGADILIKGKAIIDYNKKYLYLLNKKKKS